MGRRGVQGFLFAAMAVQVKLWILEGEFSIPTYYSKVKVVQDETFDSLRARLEGKGALEWDFDFWDMEESCRIRRKMEGLNDVGSDVYLVRAEAPRVDSSKRRRLEDGSFVVDPVEVQPENDRVVLLGDDGSLQDVDLVGSSHVSGGAEAEDSVESHLKSTLIPKDVMDRYMEVAEKVKSDLKCASQEDNGWYVKSWDHNGVGVVKIFCVECRKETSGESGNYHKTAIQNLFNNFKAKHLQSTSHIKNFCLQHDVNYLDHPQSIAAKGKAIHLTPQIHRRLVDESVRIMEEVNDSLDPSHKPFTVLGDLTHEHPKSFWMKVKCAYCRDLLSLCPPKKKLEWNMRHHLASNKHLEALEVSREGKRKAAPLFFGYKREASPFMREQCALKSTRFRQMVDLVCSWFG